MNEMNTLDIELLTGYFDNLGKEMLEKMLDLYSQQAPKYISAIDDAMATDSQGLWHEACHKMKGAAGSAGLCKVQQQLAFMEELDDKEIKQAHILKLQQLNEQGIAAFVQWLGSI